jgi:hypothetical protein
MGPVWTHVAPFMQTDGLHGCAMDSQRAPVNPGGHEQMPVPVMHSPPFMQSCVRQSEVAMAVVKQDASAKNTCVAVAERQSGRMMRATGKHSHERRVMVVEVGTQRGTEWQTTTFGCVSTCVLGETKVTRLLSCPK